MSKIKVYRGVIRNYQLHHLAIDFDIDKIRNEVVDFRCDEAMVFTGTVVEDPTGRFLPGYHMRSSLITYLNKETGECETMNTKYKLIDEGGDILPDCGNKILTALFY